MEFSRRLLLGGGALALSAAAVASADARVRRVGGPRSYGPALNELSRYVEQHRTDIGLPGVTICVVDRDGFVGFIEAGHANVDSRTAVNSEHVFQIGSISKVFTALTLASLAQEGRVSFDARVRDLMPDMPIAGGDNITLQHLLNHTSGMPGNPPLFPPGGLWSANAPGSHWWYCNTGYQIAGMIAAKADGRTLREAIEARVLQPLGMTNSFGDIRTAERPLYPQGYEPLYWDRTSLRPIPLAPAPWVDTDNGAGCIGSTAGDMARFLQFLLRLSQGDGAPIISDAAGFLANPADAPDWAEGARYGNGLARIRLEERPFITHTGGMVSFCSAMHVDVEAGIAAFASSNISHGIGYRPNGITIHACKLIRAAREGLPAPVPLPTRPSIQQPEQYAGVFTAQSGESFEVRVAGEQIALRFGGRDSALQRRGGDFFASTELRFQSGIIFAREGEAVVRAWSGDVEFVRDASMGYRAPAPAELQAYAGLYYNDDRWNFPVSVVARDGAIWLDNMDPLTRLPDGSWRGSDERAPERIRFDGFVDGRPTQLWYSGSPFVRRFS